MVHYSLGSKDDSIRRDDINFLGSLVVNEDICLVNISEQIKWNSCVQRTNVLLVSYEQLSENHS